MTAPPLWSPPPLQAGALFHFTARDLSQAVQRWLMQKPINPTTSRAAPATIIQSGYSIAESMLIRAPYLSYLHRNLVAVLNRAGAAQSA